MPVWAQSLIRQTLKARSARDQLIQLIDATDCASRSALSRLVCRLFDFPDACGRLQIAGCQNVLRGLQADRIVHLPAPLARALNRTPVQLDGPVPPPSAVPLRLATLRPVELCLMTRRAERAIWNTLIAREHPQGLTTFAGCQLR